MSCCCQSKRWREIRKFVENEANQESKYKCKVKKKTSETGRRDGWKTKSMASGLNITNPKPVLRAWQSGWANIFVKKNMKIKVNFIKSWSNWCKLGVSKVLLHLFCCRINCVAIYIIFLPFWIKMEHCYTTQFKWYSTVQWGREKIVQYNAGHSWTNLPLQKVSNQWAVKALVFWASVH